MKCKARLSCRLPPRFRRWRCVCPEEAGDGCRAGHGRGRRAPSGKRRTSPCLTEQLGSSSTRSDDPLAATRRTLRLERDDLAIEGAHSGPGVSGPSWARMQASGRGGARPSRDDGPPRGWGSVHRSRARARAGRRAAGWRHAVRSACNSSRAPTSCFKSSAMGRQGWLAEHHAGDGERTPGIRLATPARRPRRRSVSVAGTLHHHLPGREEATGERRAGTEPSMRRCSGSRRVAQPSSRRWPWGSFAKVAASSSRPSSFTAQGGEELCLVCVDADCDHCLALLRRLDVLPTMRAALCGRPRPIRSRPARRTRARGHSRGAGHHPAGGTRCKGVTRARLRRTLAHGESRAARILTHV